MRFRRTRTAPMLHVLETLVTLRQLRTLLVLLIAGATLCACSAKSSGTSPVPDTERLPDTARFTVTQFPEKGGSEPVAIFRGTGDFGNGELEYTAFNARSGEPIGQRMEFGEVSYSKFAGDDPWSDGERASEPGRAVITIRNTLVASNAPVDYLNTVASDTTRTGIETVEGEVMTAYRGTANLGKAGGPDDYEFPIMILVDQQNRLRRFEYHPIGSAETFRWDFFDYGIKVDLEPPIADQGR